MDPASASSVAARARTENFPVASFLFPRPLRPHLRAIYGFARLVDILGDEFTADWVEDAVGSPLQDRESAGAAGKARVSSQTTSASDVVDDRLAVLDELEAELEACYTRQPRWEVMRELQPTIRACSLPREPFLALIEANRIDQRIAEYETWADLRHYCVHSADPVGRLVLGVLGRAEPELIPLSDDVCTGLQLVNFLQDVPRDLELGRVYLPAEDRRRFGVTELDRPSPELRRLLEFEADRARGLLGSGEELGRRLGGGRVGRAVAVFARGGLAALEALERAEWDIFNGRPRPSRARLALAAIR
jgi:squalene synthase HpnC